ncbi:zinc transporter [Salinisphaera dokdonensis CL-ES53]|uniref:Zinc transporter n=1 Tax=Salinisphaera dokdonensis CL-ES53 TaxID=1304272 RepID=A0ABV2AZK6_9GAMM
MARAAVSAVPGPDRDRAIATGVAIAFVLALVAGAMAGYDKVVFIAVTGGFAMFAGAAIGYRPAGDGWLWQALDGVAGGAMIAAACVLLLPKAMTLDAPIAGVGVAAGLWAGLALHHACRAPRHARGALHESRLLALTVHSAGVGLVIGLIYARLPDLGVWLGTAIVAHKLPAGYAVARRLRERGDALAGVTWPACIVGIAAVPTALVVGALPPSISVAAACQGVATGIFLHVGLECVALDGPGADDTTRASASIGLPVLTGMGLMLVLRLAIG